MSSNEEVYVIRRWTDSGFVKAGQNDRGRSMPWVAIPTKHDGKGFLRLSQKDPTGSIYGIWIMLVAIAGKLTRSCEHIASGVLADEDGPLSADDLALKMRRSPEAVSEALEVLCSQEIKWIEKELASNVLAIRSPTEQNGTERNGTDRTEQNCPSVPGSPDGLEGQRTESDCKHVSVFRKLTRETLTDEQQLRSWFEWQAGQSNAVCDDSPASWVHCRKMAARCLKEGKRPERLFASIMGKQGGATQ